MKKKNIKIIILLFLISFCLIGLHFYIQTNFGNISYRNTLLTEYHKNYPKKGLQKIDAICFAIITPIGWKHYTGWGNDNIFGYLKTNNGILLHYDYTMMMGGANSIAASEDECIIGHMHFDSFKECKTDLFVPNPTNTKIIEKGLANNNEDFEYLAKVKICDSIHSIDYNLKEETKNHSFEIIDIGGVPHKLVYPKQGKNGYVGIYDFGNKNLYGENIDSENKREIIDALKTIEWKKIW